MKRPGLKGHHPQPGLPGVNLLSSSAFQRIATRKLRHRFLAAGIALVLLIVAGWTLQHLRVRAAEQLAAVETAETARLGAGTKALAPVRTFVTGVDVQKQTVEKNMSNEIYLSEVLDNLQRSTPSGIRLESVAVTASSSSASGEPVDPAAPVLATCPGPDPFVTRTVVGCIILAGTATSRAEVGELVENLGGSKLFVEPFISTTTTADTDGVSFGGSVGLSEAAYSSRYGEPVPAATEVKAP